MLFAAGIAFTLAMSAVLILVFARMTPTPPPTSEHPSTFSVEYADDTFLAHRTERGTVTVTDTDFDDLFEADIPFTPECVLAALVGYYEGYEQAIDDHRMVRAWFGNGGAS